MRDNHTWLADLSSEGPRQASALEDLRSALIRGLHHGLAHRLPPDESFVEDIAQEALVRTLSRLETFEGRSRFVTWATAIAIHLALNELRRRRWKDVSLDEVVEDTNLLPERAVDDGPGPGARWERKAIVDAMHQVIRGRLTEKQRTALLAELKGMPQAEIARHIGSNRNAVYKLTHDARRRLKKGLEEAGYRATDVLSAFAG